MMDRRTFLGTTASTTLLATLAGCGDTSDTESGNTDDDSGNGNGNDNGGSSGGSEGDQGNDIEILSTNFSWDSQMSWAKVSGEVKNNSDQELSYLEIQAYFYSEEDGEGTRLGNGVWNANNVRPGETLAYETTAAQMDQPPKSYNVEISNAY